MAVIGVGYSIASLSALLALDVTTLLDGYARYVNDDGWYQYRSGATTGGIPPTVGAGRWFKSSGRGYAIPVTANFDALPFGEYIGNNTIDIFATLPSSPAVGTSVTFIAKNTGKIKLSNSVFINAIFLLDLYLAHDKEITLRYLDSSWGWVCPSEYILKGLGQALYKLFFYDGTVLKSDLYGTVAFSDTGSTPLGFVTGFVGTYALNFNNATANYQLSSTDTALSPVTFTTNSIDFAFFANITSGTEPIISQKVTGSANYSFVVRIVDSTHIKASVTTTAGTFDAIATVSNAYSTNLLIIVSITTEIAPSPKRITLQVGDPTSLGSIVSTAFTGSFQASDNVIIGQSESGNQIVGLIDERIRFYNTPLDSNQRSLLWNNGAFA